MKRKGLYVLSACVLAAGMTLGGCTVPDSLSNIKASAERIFHSDDEEGGGTIFRVGTEKCSPAEARVVLMSYQKQYANLYGVDMWSTAQADSLEAYVKDLTITEMADVYTMDAIAVEQDITLTQDEVLACQNAAAEYCDGLSKEEKNYINCSENTVSQLYERYLLAENVYATLTSGVNQEVSDDEARVMHVRVITTTDAAAAQDAYDRLEAGEDFGTVAEDVDEGDDSEQTINRSSFSQEISDVVFQLKDDQYSEVLTDEDGNSYIFYCLQSYDEDLTAAHKSDVVNERKQEAVSDIYSKESDSLSSELSEANWAAVKIDRTLSLTAPSFLEVFEADLVQD